MFQVHTLFQYECSYDHNSYVRWHNMTNEPEYQSRIHLRKCLISEHSVIFGDKYYNSWAQINYTCTLYAQ
jgi:hypothetical protein